MNTLYLGVGLMALGIVLWIMGRVTSSRSSSAATGGSVSVGRDNIGSIQNTNIGSHAKEHAGGHALTKLAIAVEIIGIGVTIWHAFHLAAQ